MVNSEQVNNRRRCGIFGGTFDPIHRGHVDTVKQVRTLAKLQQIRYIPAAIPPHRPQPGANAAQRLAMVEFALADYPQLVGDNLELTRAGPSYTIDTLTRLTARDPETDFYLILGLDAVLGLPRWHRWQAILQRVTIIAMPRPGWQLPTTPPQWLMDAGLYGSARQAAKIRLLPINPNPISATVIRSRLATGEDVSAMLHPEVWHYIQFNNLYV